MLNSRRAFDGPSESGHACMKRIASLTVLLSALIEFVIEHANFDLWMLTVGIVGVLWNFVRRALRSGVDLQERDNNLVSKR
jgi:hypothetical protein